MIETHTHTHFFISPSPQNSTTKTRNRRKKEEETFWNFSTTPAGQPICKEKRSSELFFKNKNKTIEIVWEFPRSSDG
jgi:hypothetical protein